ncbi:OB-fold domain-containing protein [Mycolicibacterium austroafricanum]|uniref:OB-fold domain-containing protein n=1 Tax=Mycolicibacterium austroafricanum TaxID=39687 RepID=UPI001CA313FA|nr:OB-fold domain-containing protein [Mycolicibacterium austroafricanum]QZT59568.1 OB-fold domain-containing protein [Mycolicibacterium austroafricanum]
MSTGLLGYGAYVPRHRLGRRVVAGYDEDSTTMAVAAAQAALPAGNTPQALLFATSTPAYADKTNATAIHAALGLPEQVLAADLCGTGRSAFAAIRWAAQSGGLAVCADVRVGRPGSADEKLGGDGAAALLFGDGDPIAEVLGTASRTEEFLDRWRAPNSVTGQQWEERFGFEKYTRLIRSTAADALNAAGLADADHVVLACPNTAVGKRAATLVKGQKSVTTSPVGFGGAADAAIALCGVLDTADPGDTILVLSATDGCDALVLRATANLATARQRSPLAGQLAGGLQVPQLTYLSWRGLIEFEPPRRPEPDRVGAPPASRAAAWKFGLIGARCGDCDFVHLPPARVCRRCAVVDQMTPVPVSGLEGTVVTYTVDRLAYSPSPPMVQAVVDVDGGGRCTVEVADAEQDALHVGARVRFSFRRLFTAGDIHDYFWKAVLVDERLREERGS